MAKTAKTDRDQPAEVVREYGPFPGAPHIGGVSFDGSLVWFAAERLQAFDPASGDHVRALDVASDAGTTVKVTLADGREVNGEVVAFDAGGLDLAAVQIRGETDLPTIPIAAPHSVRVGQRAFAIGSPFGFRNTFTTGIVSRIDDERGVIQTDAAINPGNSGGRCPW